MTAFSNRTLDRSLPIGPDSRNRFEIGHEVEARFRRAGYLALRDVACDVRAGTVRLQGHLPTYYLKQVAQQVAGEVEGVRAVLNQIEVTTTVGSAPKANDRISTKTDRYDRTDQ